MLLDEATFMNAVFSKYPLSTIYIHPITSYIAEMRQVINVLCQLPNGEKLNIFATHLDVFDDTENTRVQQLEQIFKLMKQTNNSDHNTMLVGDMNALRKKDYPNQLWELFKEHDKKRGVITQSKAIDFIEANRFVDCFEKMGIAPPSYTTWNGRKIDYFFLSPSWTFPILGAYIYHNCASDHCPLIIDLALTPKL